LCDFDARLASFVGRASIFCVSGLEIVICGRFFLFFASVLPSPSRRAPLTHVFGRNQANFDAKKVFGACLYPFLGIYTLFLASYMLQYACNPL
jgi:hypothetical protein